MENSLSLTVKYGSKNNYKWVGPYRMSSIKKIYILYIEKKNVIRSAGKYKIGPLKIYVQILSILVVGQNLKTSIIFSHMVNVQQLNYSNID